ncbi:MAG: M48 family metalloprotease [Phycisphaerae bacterium]
MNKLHLTIAAILLGLSALAAGCGSGAVANHLVSTDSEILLGDKTAPEFEQMLGGKVADAAVQSYVQAVGQKLAVAAPRRMPYAFYVVESEVANAFSLPGGRVYVTAGLLAMLDSERQLAAVLANQIAHVCRRDPVKILFDEMKGQLLVSIARLATEDVDQSGYLVAIQVAKHLVAGRHTRKEEILADQMGMEMMARAGYNPWGMPELLAMLHNRHRVDPDSVRVMLSCHPLTDKRFKLTKLTAEVDYHWQGRGHNPESTISQADIKHRLSIYRQRRGQRSLDPGLITLQRERFVEPD